MFLSNTLPSEKCIVTGERLQSLCDVFLGFQEDFQYNPKWKDHKDKCLSFDTIPQHYNNPELIFCYSHRIDEISKYIPRFMNPFVLILHNSDANIEQQYLPILDNPIIQRVYSQNLLIKNDKCHYLPIGIANSMWKHGDTAYLYQVHQRVIQGIITKTKDIYFNFNVSTNPYVRKPAMDILSRSFALNVNRDYRDYLNELAEHRYAFCPIGNGVDTHRFWECIYLNVIPICNDNTFTKMLKKDYSQTILVDDWNYFQLPKDYVIPKNKYPSMYNYEYQWKMMEL